MYQRLYLPFRINSEEALVSSSFCFIENLKSGCVFSIHSRITDWSSGFVFRRTVNLISEEVVTAFECWVPQHFPTALWTQKITAVCIHWPGWDISALSSHSLSHPWFWFPDPLFCINMNLFPRHFWSVLGSYSETNPKCFVLDILLWKYLPADSMDKNVPRLFCSVLQSPPAFSLQALHIQVPQFCHDFYTGPKYRFSASWQKNSKQQGCSTIHTLNWKEWTQNASFPHGKKDLQETQGQMWHGVSTATLLSRRLACIVGMQPLLDAFVRVDVTRVAVFSAVKRIIGHCIDRFNDIHKLMQSHCKNDECGIWSRFANLRLDPWWIHPHFCNKGLPDWLVMVLLKYSLAPKLELCHE